MTNLSAEWLDLPESTRVCGYVKRTASLCGESATFVLDIGFTGLGSCVEHLGRLVARHFDADAHEVRIFDRERAPQELIRPLDEQAAARFAARYGHAPTRIELEEYVAENERPARVAARYTVPADGSSALLEPIEPESPTVRVHTFDADECEHGLDLDADDLVTCLAGHETREEYR